MFPQRSAGPADRDMNITIFAARNVMPGARLMRRKDRSSCIACHGFSGEAEMPAVAVIDEDEAVCCQAKDCFRLAGFAVHSARTASDGAAMLRRKRFDLVLVDVFLREASGTLIAQLAANTNTRVLLTTNHAAAASRFRNFDVPHLLKPFDLQELSREATRVMAENRQVMLRVILDLERLRRGLADLEVLTEDAKRLVAVSQAILCANEPFGTCYRSAGDGGGERQSV